MTEAERLEREADETRARVAGLLDELRERAAPSQIMEDIVAHARDGARNAAQGLARNMVGRIQHHPLPYTLIGAGLAWLIVSGLRGRGGNGFDAGPWEVAPGEGAEETRRRTWNSAQETAARAAGAASAAANDAARRASNAVAQAGRIAAGAADGVSATVSDTVQRTAAALDQAAHVAADAYDGARRRAGEAAEYGARGADDARHFVQERPLVLAGLGIAVGAALAAMLPKSAAEDRWLGETSDKLKARARHAAAQGIDRLSSAAEENLRHGGRAGEAEAHPQLAAPMEGGGPRAGEQMRAGGGQTRESGSGGA